MGGGGQGWISRWPLPRRRHLPWVQRAHSAAVTDSTFSAHRLSRGQGLAPGSGRAGRQAQRVRPQGRGGWKREACPPSHQLVPGAQTAPGSCVADTHLPAPGAPKSSAPSRRQGGEPPWRGEGQGWSRLGGLRASPPSKNMNCPAPDWPQTLGANEVAGAEVLGGQGQAGLATAWPQDPYRLGPCPQPRPSPAPQSGSQDPPPPALWAGGMRTLLQPLCPNLGDGLACWGSLVFAGSLGTCVGVPHLCRTQSWLWPNPQPGSSFSSKLGHRTASRSLYASSLFPGCNHSYLLSPKPAVGQA